ETDRVSQHRFLLRITHVFILCRGLNDFGFEFIFATRLARAQHVQSNARNDCCQPCFQTANAAGVGTVQTATTLPARHRLLRWPSRACDKPLPANDLFAPRMPLLTLRFCPWSHSAVTLRHGIDE